MQYNKNQNRIEREDEVASPSHFPIQIAELNGQDQIVAQKPRISYCTTTKSSSSSSPKSNKNNKIEASTPELKVKAASYQDSKCLKFMEKMEKQKVIKIGQKPQFFQGQLKTNPVSRNLSENSNNDKRTSDAQTFVIPKVCSIPLKLNPKKCKPIDNQISQHADNEPTIEDDTEKKSSQNSPAPYELTEQSVDESKVNKIQKSKLKVRLINSSNVKGSAEVTPRKEISQSEKKQAQIDKLSSILCTDESKTPQKMIKVQRDHVRSNSMAIGIHSISSQSF